MSRVRWYHFYFLLALFDVVVILTVLNMHSRTLTSVRGLIDDVNTLDDKARWLQVARQGILELNDPGNDVFRSANVEQERRRLRFQGAHMEKVLKSASIHDIDVRSLDEDAKQITLAAEEVFKQFDLMNAEADESHRRRLLVEAGKAMAHMDDAQQRALHTLAMIESPYASKRNELLQAHEFDLQRGLDSERYFIAAVVLILVGILYFGRKLQKADRDLAIEREHVREERRERLAAIGELCSSVAHGIRNPLAAIRSSAQLTLELGRLDEDSRERLNDIMSEGSRLGDRVTKLLSFSRATVDRFERLELSKLVDSAIDEIRPELERRKVKIDREADDIHVVVQVDRHQLQQVVIELLSNAMEHSEPGDTVSVSSCAASGNGTARISVRDSGPGIPNEVRERIFDLFYTTKPSGTGIGLATVRRIARLHGGDVEVSFPDAGGSEFTVTLPLHSRIGISGARG